MKTTQLSDGRSWAGVAVALLAAAGCGDLTATVNGKVFLDDEPLRIGDQQRGIVVFRPVAGGATCTGLVEGDGGYRIATGGSSGLASGDYLVSVRVIELVESSVEGEAPTGTPITPAVYADPLTSGLSVLVCRGSNRYDIKLDSSAGPLLIAPEPPVEPEGGVQDEAEAAEEERVASESDADNEKAPTSEPEDRDGDE